MNTTPIHRGSQGHPCFSIHHWTVYTLPNGVKYYYHPKARVVTDVDITHPPSLHQVIRHLDETTKAHKKAHHKHNAETSRLVDDTTPPPTSSTWGTNAGKKYGYGATASGFAYWKVGTGDREHEHEEGRMMGLEVWLKEIAPRGYGGQGNGYADRDTFKPMTMWVDHIAKTVSADPPWSRLGGGSVKGDNDDDLGDDGELYYHCFCRRMLKPSRGPAVESKLRYWEFVESHPAHMALPPGAAEEAVEALTWSYTGEQVNR